MSMFPSWIDLDEKKHYLEGSDETHLQTHQSGIGNCLN
jgi:hypothetical protein